MEKNFGTLFSDIKSDLTNYLAVRLKILKLDLFEKTSVTASVLLYGLTLLLIVFFTMFFLFLTLGFWLGEILGTVAGGMGLVALIYFVILAVMLASRQKIQAWIVNLFLEELIKDDEIDGEEE